MSEARAARPELALRAGLYFVGLVYAGLLRSPRQDLAPLLGVGAGIAIFLGAARLLERDRRASSRSVLVLTEAVVVSMLITVADGAPGSAFFLAPLGAMLASLEYGISYGLGFATVCLLVVFGPAVTAARAVMPVSALIFRTALALFGGLSGLVAARDNQSLDTRHRKTQQLALEQAQASARGHSEVRKQREQELYDERRKLEALMQVSQRMAVARRPEELLFTIATCAMEQMQVQAAVVLLRRGDELVVEWSEGITDLTAQHLRGPIGQGLLGRLAVNGEGFLYSQLDGPEQLRKLAPLGGLQNVLAGAPKTAQQAGFAPRIDEFRCFMVVPLKSTQDRIPMGLLLVANRNMVDRFSPHDLGYLQILATDAAISMRNLFFLSELERSHYEMIQALAQAIEAKDSYTHGHVERVCTYSVQLARAMGLPPKFVEDVNKAAMLHDVGKISTPDSVLLKEGPLTNEEFEIMKQHASHSVRILRDIQSVSADVQKMVLHHHERWDGKGYPAGLAGDAIPLGAQIISVADCYDAMTSDRPYRKGFTSLEAMKRMEGGAGSQFNISILCYFFALFNYEPQENAQVQELTRQAKQKVGANLLRLPEPARASHDSLRHLDPQAVPTIVIENKPVPKRLELEA